jgi:CheY-like chemotaxis protein
MTPDSRPILLVEDSEDDVFIFQRAYRQAQLPYEIQLVTTGQEAIDYLSGIGEFADRERHPRPWLVLLDLKLPLQHGLDVLAALRALPEVGDLPVAVLTSSAEHRDIVRARTLGARAYLVKPPTTAMLRGIVAAVIGAPAGDGSKIEANLFDTPGGRSAT